MEGLSDKIFQVYKCQSNRTYRNEIFDLGILQVEWFRNPKQDKFMDKLLVRFI